MNRFHPQGRMYRTVDGKVVQDMLRPGGSRKIHSRVLSDREAAISDAKTSVKQGKFQTAYETLDKLTDLSQEQREFMGMLAYELGKNDAAKSHFQASNLTQRASRLIYCTLLYKSGHFKVDNLANLLKDDLAQSGQANAFLGIVHYNNHDYETAKTLFQKATNQNQDSEFSAVCLCTAIYALGYCADAVRNAQRFIDSGIIKPSTDQIKPKLEREYIDLPHLKISKNLEQAVEQFL